MKTFFLGTHIPSWLATAAVPLFVSRVRLAGRKSYPLALAPWALDSGGFSELDKSGAWSITPKQYATEVTRWHGEIGRLAWAASMDYMCEPRILSKTGLTVAAHQSLTIDNYIALRSFGLPVPIVPVLQGFEPDEYFRHLDDYSRRGIDLTALPLVGIGSVCRRQGTAAIEGVIKWLAAAGVKLHGFGVKLDGLRSAGPWLTSSDSMAWSFNARYDKPLPGHTHKNCANCFEYAMGWRVKIMAAGGLAA